MDKTTLTEKQLVAECVNIDINLIAAKLQVHMGQCMNKALCWKQHQRLNEEHVSFLQLQSDYYYCYCYKMENVCSCNELKKQLNLNANFKLDIQY